ncbi:hypothetical protein V2J09_000042 [Rumex salicifolius]
MAQKHRSSAFLAGGYQDDPQTSSEHGGADSPVSGEDSRAATATALSPKKGRRGIQKRVVSLRIGDVEGSRNGGGRGETYPPSDSWAWRKYGQKPIKGSPFPRGYYRCSSSKGCPARKQVERSHVDPTMLVVTYAGDHNHSVPTSKHHNSSSSAATSLAAPTTPSSPETPPTPPRPASPEPNANADVADHVSEDRRELFSCAVEFGLGGDALLDFSWLCDVAMEGPCFVGPRCDDADMAVVPVSLSMREEDESLFADLGELPECSAVFRRGRGISTCSLGPTAAAAPLCSRTG